MFDRAASGREAARLLAELRQGERTITDYSIEFSTLAAECGWNSEAQWDMFLYGLCDVIKDEIYSLDLPTGMDKLIELAIRVDTRLRGGASRHSGDCRFFHRVTFHQFFRHGSCSQPQDTHGGALSAHLVVALNGQSLPSITHATATLRLITSGQHSENIGFLLTDTPAPPVVLGHP